MKINTTLLQNIRFLWACKSWDEDKNIPPCTNKHKHSSWFLSLQEILQLAAVQFVALVLKESVLIFVTLELIPHTRCFVGYEAGGLQQSY
jgi:hypothetical protein